MKKQRFQEKMGSKKSLIEEWMKSDKQELFGSDSTREIIIYRY